MLFALLLAEPVLRAGATPLPSSRPCAQTLPAHSLATIPHRVDQAAARSLEADRSGPRRIYAVAVATRGARRVLVVVLSSHQLLRVARDATFSIRTLSYQCGEIKATSEILERNHMVDVDNSWLNEQLSHPSGDGRGGSVGKRGGRAPQSPAPTLSLTDNATEFCCLGPVRTSSLDIIDYIVQCANGFAGVISNLVDVQLFQLLD